jgi:hypothetical protein
MARLFGRRDILRGAAALCGASVAASPRGALAQSARAASSAVARLEVNARPIRSFDPRDASHLRYGALQFRSGLVLTSPFRAFGGLSALRLDEKGERFLACSDRANWFAGRLVYDGKALSGVADVTSAPMQGPDGQKITAHGWFDTESLALDGHIAYVGLERVNKILRFDLSEGNLLARGQLVSTLPHVAKLPFNRGLESLVFVSRTRGGAGHALAGTLIAISERALDDGGHIRAFLIGGAMPGEFAIRHRDDFDISDATLLPSGSLLLLERKFSLLSGLGIRIRRVPIDQLRPGAVIDGDVIFDVDLGYEIDNMEGIDFHIENGETVLTLVSDDNFSMIQRTLLLQFTLVDE